MSDESFCKLDYCFCLLFHMKQFASILPTFNEQLISGTIPYWSGSYPSYVRFPVKDSLFPIQFSLLLFQKDIWRKIAALNLLQNRRSYKRRIHFLLKLHCELCLTAYPNKIKVLVDKHFFRYFKENLGTHLTHFSPAWPFIQKPVICFAL